MGITSAVEASVVPPVLLALTFEHGLRRLERLLQLLMVMVATGLYVRDGTVPHEFDRRWLYALLVGIVLLFIFPEFPECERKLGMLCRAAFDRR